MQTLNELKYSQSVWGFQAGKAIIRRVCDVKDIFRNRNHLQIDNDRFKQRCQIIPLKRKKLACPKCGMEIVLCTPGRERYVQGLPNGKLLTHESFLESLALQIILKQLEVPQFFWREKRRTLIK